MMMMGDDGDDDGYDGTRQTNFFRFSCEG